MLSIGYTCCGLTGGWFDFERPRFQPHTSDRIFSSSSPIQGRNTPETPDSRRGRAMPLDHRLIGDAYQYARVLVESFPDRATQFISERFEMNEIDYQIIVACQAAGKDYITVVNNARQRSSETGSPPVMRRAQNISTLPNSPTTRSVLRSAAQGQAPPSPVSTSTTSKSPNNRDGTTVILAFDGLNQQQPLLMKLAGLPYSFIRSDVVDRLRVPKTPCDSVMGRVDVQYRHIPGEILTAREQVKLTWARPDANKTHRTICHVSNQIDADLLLGDTDSGEGLNDENRLCTSFLLPDNGMSINL